MNITCWNCKTTYAVGQDTISAAMAAMDSSKLDFYDVPCPSCGKVNRTKREEFVAAGKPAAEEPKMRAVDAKKAREKEREALQKKKGHKGK